MTFLPIVDRELSVTARRPGTYWLRFWVALAMLAIWLLLLSNSRYTTPAQMGQHLLNALGILAFGFSLFAGAFMTADCLSEEKREGTLGLLFLTDLKSHDVVLGKLAASSLNAFFGLLATFPILGLTMLLGGVTGREFARLMLVFATTLFFSLGIGMFASAVSQEARQAMGRAFMLVVIFAGVFPVLWWGENLALRPPVPAWLLLPSPAYTYMKAFDNYYRSGNGAQDFWLSLGMIFSIGLTGVVLAVCLLPRAWRRVDSTPAAESKGPGGTKFPHRTTFGQRAGYLNANPFEWLAGRDRASGWFALKSLMWLFPLWAIFLVASFFVRNRAEIPFTIAMFSAYGLHLVVKVLIATEASRRMNQDRQSGALELLLATPISVEAILSGQKRALLQHFLQPMAVLVVVNLALCAAVMVDSGPLHMGAPDRGIFLEIFIGGIVMLIADFHALGWVGMWQGLTKTKHHRAVLGTLGRVLGGCWLATFLVFFIGPHFHSWGDVVITFGMWFVLGGVVDVVAGQSARLKLRAEFRQIVSQSYQGKG
jgi:ABC-type transport system involved in multi-copper enzyme maturation permease subunit